jgi:hypothetical protein
MGLRRKQSNDTLIGCTALAVYALYFGFLLTFMGAVIWLILKVAGNL